MAGRAGDKDSAGQRRKFAAVGDSSSVKRMMVRARLISEAVKQGPQGIDIVGGPGDVGAHVPAVALE